MGIENFSHDEQTSSSSLKTSNPMPIQPAPHAEHGPLVDHKIPQDDAVPSSPDLTWSRIRQQLREPFAEFWVGHI